MRTRARAPGAPSPANTGEDAEFDSYYPGCGLTRTAFWDTIPPGFDCEPPATPTGCVRGALSALLLGREIERAAAWMRAYLRAPSAMHQVLTSGPL